jgi:hypothetical protein
MALDVESVLDDGVERQALSRRDGLAVLLVTR